MRRTLVALAVCSLLLFLLPPLPSPVGPSPFSAFAQESDEAPPEPEVSGETRSLFMPALIFVVGLALLFFVFNLMVFPFLLRYYRPSYSRTLFWSLLLLYGLAWITLSAYVLFDFGFALPWLKWVFVFIGVIWVIWFLMVLLKKDSGGLYERQE